MPELVSLGPATQIFNQAVGAGVNGNSFALPSQAVMISWQCIYGTPPASITINFQVSMDGTNWSTIDTTTSTASGTVRITSVAARFCRINISAVAGGDTLQVLIVCGGLGAAKNVFGGNVVIATQAFQVATTAVITEEDLFAITIPARVHVTTGRSIRLRCWGNTAANVNVKTVRIKYGADTHTVMAGAVNNAPWTAEYILMRRAFSSYIRRGWANINAINPGVQVAVAGIDETSAQLLKVTGQNAVASAGDITLEGVIVDSIPGIAGIV